MTTLAELRELAARAYRARRVLAACRLARFEDVDRGAEWTAADRYLDGKRLTKRQQARVLEFEQRYAARTANV